MIWESNVPGRLGVSRRQARLIRAQVLDRGSDWSVDRRRVVWTQEALEKAARFLAANPDTVPGLALSDDGSAEKTAPGAAGTQSGPSTEIVTVHRWKFPKNVHVIQAKRSTGEVINVLVRSNRNFREVDWRGRTMKLEVFKDTTCWRIKDNCPRWPGKW